jgi:hypothetical protein
MMKFWLAVVAVAACSHGSSGGGTTAADKPKPAGPPSCEVVRDHLLSLLKTEDAPKEDVAEVGNVILSHCRDDAWSADARACWTNATMDNAKGCENLLTQAQKASIDDDFDKRHPPEAAAARAPQPEPTAAPPPPPSPNPSRAPKSAPRKPAGASGDPCEGGQ